MQAASVGGLASLPTFNPKPGATKMVQVEETFCGPLPPPSALAEYDAVAPGSAERIISMAERESEHRHSMDKAMLAIQGDNLRANRKERWLGQVLGFTVCICVIAGGVIIATFSAGAAGQIGGSVMGASGLASLVIAFMTGRKGESLSPEKENGPK